MVTPCDAREHRSERAPSPGGLHVHHSVEHGREARGLRGDDSAAVMGAGRGHLGSTLIEPLVSTQYRLLLSSARPEGSVPELSVVTLPPPAGAL